MAKKFIFKIKDKRKQKYFQGWTSFGETGIEYHTEAGARSAIDRFVHSVLGSKLYSSVHRGNSYSGLTDKTLKEWFPYELEIEKIEVIHQPAGSLNVDSTVKNMFISNKLQDVSYSLSRFWDNAIKKNYADNIKFIVKLDISKGKSRAEAVKEARAQLRLLGIKTRTFREYDGMFGFYDRDQAFKARLTLNVTELIDIDDIKKELFSDG